MRCKELTASLLDAHFHSMGERRSEGEPLVLGENNTLPSDIHERDGGTVAEKDERTCEMSWRADHPDSDKRLSGESYR